MLYSSSLCVCSICMNCYSAPAPWSLLVGDVHPACELLAPASCLVCSTFNLRFFHVGPGSGLLALSIYQLPVYAAACARKHQTGPQL